MKRIFLIFITVLAITVLSACGQTGDKPVGDSTDSQNGASTDNQDGTNTDNQNGTETECTHEGGTASCVSKAVCTLCGEEYGELSDSHSPSDKWTSEDGRHYHACINGCGAKLDLTDCDIDVDCTHTGTCSVCGAEGTSLNPDKHNISSEWTNEDGKHYHACLNGCGVRFDEGTCDISATCVSAGVCSVCGDEGVAVDAAAHKPASEWTAVGGIHYKVCENGCGAKLNEGTCDAVATCVSVGVCSVCNTAGDAIDPNNHNFGKEYTMDSEKHYKTCENGCGASIEEGEHGFSDWVSVSASTTSTRGTLERTCGTCGKTETKDSPALIMSVKGGAKSIFVLIHDDGNWNTVTIADELYREYGLIGDVAMTLKTAFMSTGVKDDFTDDTANMNNVLKWRTLFDTNRWKLVSHSMTHTWWGTYDKSTDADGNTVCENLTRSEQLEIYEIVKSQALLRTYFPGQNVLTFAHPGFAEPKNYIPGVSTGTQKYDAVYNEEARILMDKYYIAARGTLNSLIDLDDPQGTWESSSTSSGYASKTYSDIWNYVPSYCVDDNLTKYLTAANNAVANGDMAVFFIHKLSENESDKDNSNTMYSGNYETFLQTIASHVNSGDAWNAFFEDAVMYVHEAASARADVRINGDVIYVTVTDDASQFMLNEDGSSTGEEIYTYPLTVRVDVPESWEAIRYEQNGEVGYAAAKLVDGRWVADAEIVPDIGEAIITEASLADIPESEEPAPVVGSEVLEYDASYSFDNGIADVTANLPASSESTTSVETVNGDNKLHITKAQPSGNPSWTLYGGYASTVASSMSVSFKMQIDEATLKEGSWGNITGNKRIMHITFGDTSPYSLVVYRDITDSTDGTSGTLYLTDCKDSNYTVKLSDNMICELELGREYEIRVEVRMDGVNDLLAEIYVDGTKVKESSYAMNYTVGTVPTVEYVQFLAQGRAVIDVLIDDVTMKTTAPTGTVDVTVYEEDFDGQDVAMTTGSNNTVTASYGSPADDGRVALNINKATTNNTTHSWIMQGASVTDAKSFTFKFDVYIDADSVASSSTRLYQIHFASSTPYILTIELNSDKTGYVLKDMANASAVMDATVISDTISFNEWHTIELAVNLDGEFGAMAYVDGVTNGAVSANYGRTADTDAVRCALDRVTLYAQKASGANIYFDNFSLTAVVDYSAEG